MILHPRNRAAICPYEDLEHLWNIGDQNSQRTEQIVEALLWTDPASKEFYRVCYEIHLLTEKRARSKVIYKEEKKKWISEK